MRTVADIPYSDASEKCLLDLYLPEHVEQPPVYIFFHGGGLEGGDRKLDVSIPAFFTDNGIALVSVEYRMYPQAKFPDYLVDAAQAVYWTLHRWEHSFGTVFIGGASAGAYISMMLYFNKDYLRNARVDPNRIKGYIFDGGQPTSHFNYLHYDKGMDSRRVTIDEAAPIYYLSEPYSCPQQEPDLFFACGDNDIPNRVNQTNVLVTAMQQFGFPEEKCLFKIYENETHSSYSAKEFYLQDTLAFMHKAMTRT